MSAGPREWVDAAASGRTPRIRGWVAGNRPTAGTVRLERIRSVRIVREAFEDLHSHIEDRLTVNELPLRQSAIVGNFSKEIAKLLCKHILCGHDWPSLVVLVAAACRDAPFRN